MDALLHKYIYIQKYQKIGAVVAVVVW